MIDDKTLRKVLAKKIKQFTTEYPRTAMREVEKTMAVKYNVKYGDTVDIFNGIEKFSVFELDYNMLYKFMMSMRELALDKYQTLDPSDLRPETYFTPSEINEFERPFPDEEKDFDLVITDWKQTAPYKYTVYLDTNEKIKWRNHNKLRFNPETQRDLIEIRINGNTFKRLDINTKAVSDMQYLMKNNLYYPVKGTANINPDYNEELPYVDGKNLIIPMGCHIDLIEGFHNYLAETGLKDKDADFNMNTELDIMMLTTDEANMFIKQMDTKTHFKKAQITRIDKLNETNYLIDRLNKSREFHLHGTIDNKMKVYLNGLMSTLFKIDEDKETARGKVIELLPVLEESLSYIVEKEKHLNSPFTKYEWFIYLNVVKFSIDNNIRFKNIIDIVDVESLKEEFKIVNVPLPKHYKLIKNILSEVHKNDLL